jgi:putative hydrolase of HD superfamily
MTMKRDIEFMFEMGSVRFMERMWRRFLHDDFANQAEHHFRVFWIAMIIAAHEEGADTGRIAKLALVHDIAENRTGDVDYLARQYCERKGDLAIRDMLADTAIEKEFYELFEEYEARETLEAKIVKDADNLDVDFELAEQKAKGSQLFDVKHNMRDTVAKTKLYTETAKEIYKELQSANPHDWHYNARNRINGGDWKQK